MNNVRFATSLHILTLLNLSEEEMLSSEYIAGSININPAIVRKEISNLRDHQFVGTREGKGGGAYLQKSPKEIHLSAVYKAIVQVPILGRSNTPNPECPVGKQINGVIEKLYTEAEEALLQKLESITLEDFNRDFS
jgi:DNA-binding IscR family transcriptional regulator